MLLFTSDDPARYWQLHTHAKGHDELHEVMADVFGYALERQNVHKGEITMVRPDPAAKTDRAMKIARLKYPGNWDPEPAGWRRMAAILRNQDQIDATVEPVELGAGKLDTTYAVAVLTGASPYKLTPAAKEELKKYVEGGGTLLADACGGSTAYAASAQADLCAVFSPGQALLPVLAPGHAVYARDLPGAPKLGEVEYRAFARPSVGMAWKTGRLRGLDIKGRTAVYFSAEDLSTALNGHTVDGILGYTPATATRIVQRILLLSAPAPATQPATKPVAAAGQ